MSYDFSTTVHGKWILAGEHAVIRGNPAIVIPLPSFELTLHYLNNGEQLRTVFNGTFGEEMHLLLSLIHI